MVRRVLARYGVRYSVLSIEDVASLEAKLATEPTRLIVFESPTNPLLKIADIERITTLAKTHGALTLLDNTLAGFHNHGGYDIDVYIHSLTKYASGHGDVMGGAVIAHKELITSMRPDFIVMGATLDPHAAYLTQRGLKTYALRYERQCENALRVAKFLEQSTNVENVRYPGLPSHRQHELARKQMRDFGSVISFELKNGKEKMKTFVQALRLFPVSASLGSTESLILPPQMQVPRDLSKTERGWSGITENTVRLSIGIEAVEDLIEDLGRALSECEA
jgi:cystathionine beta-lyase/cystathionine gamma-synthase